VLTGVLEVVRRTYGVALAVVLALAVAVFLVSGVSALLAGQADTGIGLVSTGLVLGGLALLVVQMRRTPHVEMQVSDGQLLVRFGGWDTLWTLRRAVRVPLPQIEQVTVRQIGALRPRWWWRLRGTELPGVLRAGSFVARGGRELWDVRQGAVVVDIELAESAPFRRIVLEVPDPAVAAEQLRSSSDR
jgi:hypothetical protein